MGTIKKIKEINLNVFGLLFAPLAGLVEKLKFEYELHKLFAKEDKMLNKYAELKRQAKSKDEKEQLYCEESAEYFAIRDEIETLVSGYLCDKASELYIPMPKLNDSVVWKERYPNSGRYILTGEGVALIRSLIRKEKKEKREDLVTFLTVLIGLIGAISGLIAVFKSQN